MTSIIFSFLLATQVFAIELDVNEMATASRSGSFDDVEMFIQEEAQVLNTLIELDNQLNSILNQVSSASGSTEIDVVVRQPETATSGSDLWIHDEMVVVVPPGAHLSDDQKETIKQEIENEVANTLDAMIVVGSYQEDTGNENDRVTRLFDDEVQAEKDLEQMKEEIKTALDNLSASGDTEIDVMVTTSDGDKEILADENVVVIPGSGPRLTEQEKEKLEEEIVDETADALGTALMKEFLDDTEQIESAPEADTRLQDDPRLEEDSPEESTLAPEKGVQAAWKDVEAKSDHKPVLRSAAATAIAQPGFEHPMFVPHHWQMQSDEQLWTMKLSMLTSISCMTLLLIVGVWTGVRRSRRRAVIDDRHFRWAEAVEYMDAFPYEP